MKRFSVILQAMILVAVRKTRDLENGLDAACATKSLASTRWPVRFSTVMIMATPASKLRIGSNLKVYDCRPHHDKRRSLQNPRSPARALSLQRRERGRTQGARESAGAG